MWRNEAGCGRAGQAFKLAEPGVANQATASSLAADRHGPQQGWSAVFPKPQFRVSNTKGRAFRRVATISDDFRAALVDEPMAQLHECATRLLDFLSSGYRPDTSDQAGRARS
jgi:hypothetical protein